MARYYQCSGCDVTFQIEVLGLDMRMCEEDAVCISVLETPARWTLRWRIAKAWEVFRKGEACVQHVTLTTKRARAMVGYILRRLNEVEEEG